ncbi:MAG: ArsR family transcriptional regulator [Lachnospiraceae bacterium]|nr:ArsR family transcriptional regulator [Lachnospiraceae bacterium]
MVSIFFLIPTFLFRYDIIDAKRLLYLRCAVSHHLRILKDAGLVRNLRLLWRTAGSQSAAARGGKEYVSVGLTRMSERL